jgi:hypothetical protein
VLFKLNMPLGLCIGVVAAAAAAPGVAAAIFLCYVASLLTMLSSTSLLEVAVVWSIALPAVLVKAMEISTESVSRLSERLW